MIASDWAGFLQRPFLSRERLKAFQDRRIRELVSHSFHHIPFWQRRISTAGLTPQDFRSAADLARLPVLTKQDLRETPFEDLLDGRVPEAQRRVITSSGTTGEPIRFVRTAQEQHKLYAYRLRAQMLSGLRPWHTRMKIGSRPEILWAHKLGLFRCGNVDPRLLPEQILTALEQARADILYFPPATGEVLLASVDPDRLRKLAPKLIFTGAELLRPAARAAFREIFGCPVVDFYGTMECNLIAWECSRCGSYHTCDDAVYVEVVRDDGTPAADGEEGRLLITALHSFAFPLIRYDVGDVIRRPQKAPPCSIQFGALEAILGRRGDYLRLPDGTWLSAHHVVVIAHGAPGVQRFQCIQTGPRQVVWKIQPGRGYGEQTVRALIDGIRAAAPEFEVSVDLVNEFPLTAAGKHRLVIAWREDASGDPESAVPPASQHR